jgi:hypothetical protein
VTNEQECTDNTDKTEMYEWNLSIDEFKEVFLFFYCFFFLIKLTKIKLLN